MYLCSEICSQELVFFCGKSNIWGLYFVCLLTKLAQPLDRFVYFSKKPFVHQTYFSFCVEFQSSNFDVMKRWVWKNYKLRCFVWKKKSEVLDSNEGVIPNPSHLNRYINRFFSSSVSYSLNSVWLNSTRVLAHHEVMKRCIKVHLRIPQARQWVSKAFVFPHSGG